MFCPHAQCKNILFLLQSHRWLCQHANKRNCYLVITALQPRHQSTVLLKDSWPWRRLVWGGSMESGGGEAGVRRWQARRGGGGGFRWKWDQRWLLMPGGCLLLLGLCMSLHKKFFKAVLSGCIHTGQAQHRVFGFLNGAPRFLAGGLNASK